MEEVLVTSSSAWEVGAAITRLNTRMSDEYLFCIKAA
jgi:hypothetical protein